MGIRRYKPTSPGRRGSSVLDFAEITKTRPEKTLTRGITKHGGRNNQGFITCRHRGGGHKRLYREIDFLRDKLDIPARVAAVEYDPNRSAFIALLHYADGEKRYILAPEGLQVGTSVLSAERTEPNPGNSMPIENIPLGLMVHAVEIRPGSGARIARAAGTVVQLSAREGSYAVLTMPSGEIRRVHVRCRATIGQVGNLDHGNIRIGKAGRKRHMGRRPIVRGSAMNPHDHPMGGGEGRRAGGRHPVSPTGMPTKGFKTRRRTKPSGRFIIRRRRGKR
jgi:large subunit ribosomal protein L2